MSIEPGDAGEKAKKIRAPCRYRASGLRTAFGGNWVGWWRKPGGGQSDAMSLGEFPVLPAGSPTGPRLQNCTILAWANNFAIGSRQPKRERVDEFAASALVGSRTDVAGVVGLLECRQIFEQCVASHLRIAA